MDYPKSLRELLENSATKYGSRIALSEFKDGNISEINYSTLHKSALEGANKIIESGVESKTNIAILMFYYF